MNAPAVCKPSIDKQYADDFPILAQKVRGQRLAYLDNGATTQKPASVIDAEARFYRESNANIHRGVHWLSQHATDLYEAGRETVRAFLNAERSEEIVFTRGTTESINLVAQSWARSTLSKGDEILITAMEHHSNIVPWQMICQQTGATLKVAPMNERGELIMADFAELIGPRTRLVAVSHISNALGTINPVAEICQLARQAGALILIDGAQAVAHETVDVRALDCDFYAFSAHKLYGPTGIGVLYARHSVLEGMPPWQGGGDMIETVSFETSTYAPVPQRFEAGTPNIAGVIGMAAAIDYVNSIGLDSIARHEAELLQSATSQLLELPGIRLVGTAAKKAGILSFMVDGIHPHDLGTILDMEGVAIRAGHHCAMPIMTQFGIPGTARASFALYNTDEDVQALIKGVRKAQALFGMEQA